jgi:hypothetical protein
MLWAIPGSHTDGIIPAMQRCIYSQIAENGPKSAGYIYFGKQKRHKVITGNGSNSSCTATKDLQAIGKDEAPLKHTNRCS